MSVCIVNLHISELRLHDRAVFNTCAAPGTQIHINASRTLFNFYLEIAGFAFNTFKIRICDKLYV